MIGALVWGCLGTLSCVFIVIGSMLMVRREVGRPRRSPYPRSHVLVRPAPYDWQRPRFTDDLVLSDSPVRAVLTPIPTWPE